MSQTWTSQSTSPTCLLCNRSLLSGVRVRCPHCSAETCARCSNAHHQSHYGPDGHRVTHTVNQQSPPYQYESYEHSPQQAPYFPPPPPLNQSHPQYPSQQNPYHSPPPQHQSHFQPSSQQRQFSASSPQNQYYPQYPSPQPQHFAPPPKDPSFQNAAVPQKGHRNWIAYAVDKGTTVAKHKTTKKFLKTGVKVAAIGASIVIGADVTGLADFDFDFGGGGGDAASAMAGGDPSSAFTGGAPAAPDMSSNLAQGMAMQNSAAFWTPLQTCASMNPTI